MTSDDADGHLQPEIIPTPTAGQLIKTARESVGMHIAVLAVALKVPVKKLEALERGDLQDSVDPVFVRALASSVCRHLQINPEPILELLPKAPVNKLVTADRVINAPFHRETDPPFSSWKEVFKNRTVLLVSGLLLVTLLVYSSPYIEELVLSQSAAVHSTPVAEPAPVVAMDASPLATPDAALPDSAVQGALPATAAIPPSSESNPVTIEAKPGAAVTSMEAAPAQASPAQAQTTQNAVAFRASEDSWVEVTDGAGKVLLRKLLGPSESVAVSGQYPLSVVVGKAAATQVWVHGKAYDLNPIARENVARFEVKF